MIPKELNDWLQVVGLFGVLGGLVFVGLQMKQSQDIAIGSQYTARASEAREYWQYVADQPLVLRLVGATHRDHLKGSNAYHDDLIDEEVGQLYVHARLVLVSWDNNLFQYESGFMTDEAWSVYEGQISEVCGINSAARAILANHGILFRPSLIDYCLAHAEP